MRIPIDSLEEGEKLEEKFEESHIDKIGNQWYLVVDRVKHKIKT